MTTAAGVAQQNTISRKRIEVRRAGRKRAMKLVFAGAFLCLAIVFLSVFAANLRRANNDLMAQNDYLQAEIDSLENQIGNASNINRIEDIATKQIGMVRPDSENCIALGETKEKDANLAATIKDEAYD